MDSRDPSTRGAVDQLDRLKPVDDSNSIGNPPDVRRGTRSAASSPNLGGPVETAGRVGGSAIAVSTDDSIGLDRLALPSDSIMATIGFAAVGSAALLLWLAGADATTLFLVVALTCAACAPIVFSLSRRRHRQLLDHASRWQQHSRQWESRWRALRADSEKTVTAVSQLTDGVVILSTENKILLVNPAARKLLFLSHEEEYLGRSFSEAVRDPMIKTLITSARKYQVGCGDSVELASGKTVRPIRVDVNPIELVDDGELLLIIRDETETRRVDEIRREFVANVSHELKTPLAAIKGYAETVELAIQDDPESACHFMKQILSQCQRLERLVADMMQLARAQAGTHNMTLVRIQLDDIIADALRACRPIAESKQINLTCGQIQADSRVIADREATLTIANNLISNAVRYTPEGGNVTIGAQRLNEYCALIVQDDGVGISESDQQRIFERFYRVDKTRESTGGGTGIGLSIVKNLTLAQSGQIELTSRPGEGSTFRVLLPAATIQSGPGRNVAPAKGEPDGKDAATQDQQAD